MKTLLLFLGAILLVGAIAYFDRQRRIGKLRRAFAGRRPLSDDEFFQTYFGGSGMAKEIPIRVRRILEENLDADMSRLAKEDDFTKNLKFLFAFDSLADVAIVQAVEKEFGIAISDEEAMAMHTVNDIVVGVSRHLAAANEA